ncbi:10501_t:CDS:2 [Acaulospora colombiana]|uniref:10501_t:CDS:1 n=1 Tax=Acaulospora colombiana TaxID=27376 RepID=A0ACA9M334_9GLOM|nr:10501_t:CDS:2 [Acaulospora colombiana]
MKLEHFYAFFCLIFHDLLVSAKLLSKRALDPPVNNNLFDSFTALAETPGNVIRNYTFELRKVSLAPDNFTRQVWSVNGQWVSSRPSHIKAYRILTVFFTILKRYPGPMIRANRGDTLNITVINLLGDPSSIHFHGLEQRNTNWYDGVPGVTQCPIPNGVNFSYIVNLTQSGTFWYHSHFASQYVDGLKGPIVIHDPNDPHKNKSDFEYVMTISDWYHTPTGDPSMLPRFRNENYFGFDPLPDSAEISGVGQYNCTIPTCNPNRFATYKVQRGKRYRFRIINMSAMTHFWLSIDQHPLTIIEVEGTPINPVAINWLPINIAQRYSAIVVANQSVGNYWIRAVISNCSLPVNNLTINYNTPLFANGQITGILRYDGAPATNPTSVAYPQNSSDCYDLDPTTLKPSTPPNPAVPQTTNITQIYMEISIKFPFVGRNRILVEAAINNSSFFPSTSYPSYRKVVDGSNFSSYDNAYSYNTWNEPIEIFLNNTENRTHPFHLHGHTFWVVALGEAGSYNKPLSSLKYNYDNPILRDTLTVKELGLAAIRYYANNPGIWFIHCHIEWHVEMGMVAQMVELPDAYRNLTVPDNVNALCGSFDSR